MQFRLCRSGVYRNLLNAIVCLTIGERKQDVYSLMKCIKNPISVSLSLFLSAFPSCSLSSIQIMVKHGLIVVLCKDGVVLVCRIGDVRTTSLY